MIQFTQNLEAKVNIDISLEGSNSYESSVQREINWDNLIRSSVRLIGEDEDEEAQSTLGTIRVPKRELKVEDGKLSEMMMFCVITHQCQNSHTNENFLPFARINDGKMYMCGIK